MALLSAIKADAELFTYYERKIAESKNRMNVLNPVKNKLFAGIISVVDRKEEKVKKVG